MILPRAILITNAFFLARMANSSAPRKCRVCGVSGTETSRISRSWERKLWSEDLSRPEYHAEGKVPSGSPVLGTMYPRSFLDSGVLRGEAV